MSNQRSVSGDQNMDNLVYRNKLLSEEIRRRVDQLAAINTVAATVSQSLNLDVTLETALEAVLSVIHVEAAGISLVDETAGELVMRAQRGWKYDFVTKPMRIPLGEGLSGRVVHNNEVIVTGDLTNDSRLFVQEFAREGVQAMTLVPMHARGYVVGVLSVMSYKPYEFSEDEVTVLRAIADQVGIALDNARLYERTKEQSSRLSAVLHSSGDAIIATDSYGNINLINSTAEELFDIRPDDIMGTPLRRAPLHPKLCDGLRRAMSNEQAGNTVFEVRLDSGRSLSAIVSPVYAHQLPESDEEAEGWVMVVQDVSHLREAEQTRVNFIHAAAHDLRNPLGATLGALAILEDDLVENELHRELISIALQSIDRMQDLIDNLLSLEHIESGIGVVCKRLDMREVIERCMMDVRPNIMQNHHELNTDVPDKLPTVQGDIQWLHRALMNLLGNACKYTPKGSNITIRSYALDHELYVEVEDNGPGIPLEVQPRLFERFYRVPQENQDVRGSGLGLAIVKSVVEQHGGRVFVQSRIGQGSIFGMILPVAADKQD